MSYLVLARKWRPMTFDDLIGQKHVSRTLSNAIVSGRIAHAFVFTGQRGVGKTTSARILAKSLNCEQGPTAHPCLKCVACREIAAGCDMDVQEIDGASYNGVDEVRKLQESLPYRPARDRFKVVIVDEVHMLSQNAWNAFLKTLEEPPAHVKFVFATTEVHKVPVTILSRCQRYDFKLIPVATIAKHLRYVLEREGIAADEAAVGLIAREAAGSMRDAMSLLDQALAWDGERLVGEQIAQVLGIAGRGVLFDVVEALVTGEANRVMEFVGCLADQGFDLIQVARDMLEVLRDLVVVKVCQEPQALTDLTPDELSRVRALVAGVAAEDLMRLYLGVSQGFDQVVYAPHQRGALEMLLLRLALRPPLVPIDDLLARVHALGRRLGGGASHVLAGNKESGSMRGLKAAPEPSHGAAVVETQQSEAVPRRVKQTPEALRADASETRSEVWEASVAQSASRVANDTAHAVPQGRNRFARRAEEPARDTGNSGDIGATGGVGDGGSKPEPRFGVSAVSAMQREGDAVTLPVAVAEQGRGDESEEFADDDVRSDASNESMAMRSWRQILAKVSERDAVLSSVLVHGIATVVDMNQVEVQFEKDSFYAASMNKAGALDMLSAVVREHFGAPTEVRVRAYGAAEAPPGQSVFERDEIQRKRREKMHRQRVRNNALVKVATEHLGATIQSIRLASSKG